MFWKFNKYINLLVCTYVCIYVHIHITLNTPTNLIWTLSIGILAYYILCCLCYCFYFHTHTHTPKIGDIHKFVSLAIKKYKRWIKHTVNIFKHISSHACFQLVWYILYFFHIYRFQNKHNLIPPIITNENWVWDIFKFFGINFIWYIHTYVSQPNLTVGETFLYTRRA